MRNTVSLLPPEYLSGLKKGHQVKSANRVLFIIGAILLGALALVGGLLLLQSYLIGGVKQRNSEVQMQIQELAVYEQFANEMRDLGAKVDQAKSTDVDWIARMTSVVENLPQGVWMQSFTGTTVTRDPQGVPIGVSCSVVLAGNSINDVARTINALESTIATSAVCITTNENTNNVLFAMNVMLDLNASKQFLLTTGPDAAADAEENREESEADTEETQSAEEVTP